MTAGILCLDDAALLLVLRNLDPLPDRFRAAAACKRFHRLASDPRLRLVVDPQAAARPRHPDSSSNSSSSSSEHSARVYATVGSAVLSSRPGDTVLVSPGLHQLGDVQVKHPLSFVGGGDSPSDCRLVSVRGADTALAFHATGRMFNLLVESHMASCVEHRGGRLILELCLLRCARHPLAHLVAPLETWARGAAARLEVGETTFEGGGTAVHCRGSGRVRAVRLIFRGDSPLFWFSVDSEEGEELEGDGAGVAAVQRKRTRCGEECGPACQGMCHAPGEVAIC